MQVRTSSSQNTSHVKPPSIPSATFSSNSSNEKPPEKSNLLRNIIYGLVIAVVSLGGVLFLFYNNINYYSYIFALKYLYLVIFRSITLIYWVVIRMTIKREKRRAKKKHVSLIFTIRMKILNI